MTIVRIEIISSSATAHNATKSAPSIARIPALAAHTHIYISARASNIRRPRRPFAPAREKQRAPGSLSACTHTHTHTFLARRARSRPKFQLHMRSTHTHTHIMRQWRGLWLGAARVAARGCTGYILLRICMRGLGFAMSGKVSCAFKVNLIAYSRKVYQSGTYNTWNAFETIARSSTLRTPPALTETHIQHTHTISPDGHLSRCYVAAGPNGGDLPIASRLLCGNKESFSRSPRVPLRIYTTHTHAYNTLIHKRLNLAAYKWRFSLCTCFLHSYNIYIKYQKFGAIIFSLKSERDNIPGASLYTLALGIPTGRRRRRRIYARMYRIHKRRPRRT